MASQHICIDPSLSIPLSEIELRASRSSGPGGQHANVTASRIEAVFEIDASQTLRAEQKQRLAHRFGKLQQHVADKPVADNHVELPRQHVAAFGIAHKRNVRVVHQ